MPIDLTGDFRKSLLDTLARAKRHYEAGEDEKAAAAYEAASRLLLRMAEGAPDRASEAKHKRDAIRFREVARRLASGEVPPAASRGDAPGDGAPASIVPEVQTRRGGAVSSTSTSTSTSMSTSEGELSAQIAPLVTTSSITWAEIGGLEETKREIKVALALSMARPPSGVKIAPWRNVLFYGPPGTGKTLLAAATSNAIRRDAKQETRAMFFNVKVSSILSKYFGESSKLISELYGQARDASPAVVFLDEFEALARNRDGGDDSGAERRILSTILSELDGLAEKGRRDIFVLTIAATNRPWDLDPAVLSRFEKKVLIPLPDPETRRAILDIQLSRRGFKAEPAPDELVAMTAGLSGREIERLCKDASMRMIAAENGSLPALVDQGLDAVRGYEVRVRPLSRADFEAARRRISPQTTPEEIAKYDAWRESVQA